MGKNSYAEIIKSAALMLSGLRNNNENLSRRGLDETFITVLDSLVSNIQESNHVQEDLKAKLKTKTAEMDESLEQIKKKLSEAKKIIKIDRPQESWKSYGINDKR